MASVETDVEVTKAEFSSIETLKNLIASVAEEMATHKTMLNSLRAILKDQEKTSKELEKLRSKRGGKSKTPRSPDALPSGITKPVAISDELAKFLGVARGTLVPRNEVTKGVSSFVKSNELSDPANKQKFVLDDRPAAKTLRVLLGDPKEDVTYFNLQRYLKHHYIGEKPVETSKKAPEPSPVTPEPVVVKKKILVKKAKASSELTEEA